MNIPTRFSDPARPPRRMRPFKAFAHFRKLVADKEDTAQVFHMTECLPNKAYVDQVRAFCDSPQAKALMASESSLPVLLDDHDALLRLPEGSVAHAYVAFMRREGLSAAGLVAESERAGRTRFDDQLQWFHDRLRDTHDLIHVLTGYGRDALGEQCALAFSSGQYHALTDRIIAWAGAFELWRQVHRDAPVFSAVRQAQQQGAAAEPVYAQSIRDLLAEPLEAARARMGIGAPNAYGRAHQFYRKRGIDPYKFLAAAA